MMAFNQKGEGRGRFIFGLLVFITAVYIAWKVIPVMIRVYAFEDAVKQECKFLHGRTMDELKQDLVGAAKGEDLPVTEEDISANTLRSEDHRELKVDITYSVPIATPFYVYDWKQQINYQAPVFE
jgi:hypothetical protein